MKKAHTIGIVIIAFFLIVGVGDYLNLPLWPMNWLKPHIPVEIHCRFHDVDSHALQGLLKHSDGVHVTIASTAKTVIQELTSDREGIARVVVPVGKFKVKAVYSAVSESEWFYLTSRLDTDPTEPWVTMVFDREQQTGDIGLSRVSEIPQEEINHRLELYLKEGDFRAAGVAAEKLSPDFSKDMQTLREYQEQLEQLPIPAYNSAVRLLQEMSGLLMKYLPDPSTHAVQFHGRIIQIPTHQVAILKSRNSVIQSVLDIMTEHHAAGRLDAVLEEWYQLTKNPELYPEVPLPGADLPAGMSQFEAVVASVTGQLPAELEENYNQCVQLYQNGDLRAARQKFTRLLTHLRNMNLLKEYPEMESDIRSYLDDIAIITSANNEIRMDHLESALALLDLVLTPNELVHRKIEETQQFLQMRTHQPLERPTP